MILLTLRKPAWARKDIIGAYLTSAGNERAELTVTDATSVAMEVVEKEVDIRSNSIIAVVDNVKEAVVTVLDSEISSVDEELNSGDSMFHGWTIQTVAVPRTALSTMLESAGAELVQKIHPNTYNDEVVKIKRERERRIIFRMNLKECQYSAFDVFQLFSISARDEDLSASFLEEN